jgi:hypothetical protein
MSATSASLECSLVNCLTADRRPEGGGLWRDLINAQTFLDWIVGTARLFVAS